MLSRTLTALLLSTAVMLPAIAFAADPLSPRVEVSAKGGNKRSILSTQIWAPLAQRDDRVLYADVRLMGDNDENREGNFGLGYREINPYTNTVIGFHGWYDQRRTKNDSTFRQLTFGAESLGHVWDMRVNGYIPLNKSRTLGSTGTSDPYLAGTGIYYDINGFLVETPQYGVDGEIGYRLPVLQDKADAIRVYGGGYHFFRDNTDNVTGFRVRTEAQVNSAFSLGARYQYDEPRGSQGFLEATIRFPFGAKKLYQETGLRSRLDESAERDVDIVTSAKVAPGQKGVAVVNTVSGDVQRVIHVDNSNPDGDGGAGTLENPYTTLSAAEAVMQANDVIYINYGTGDSTGMDQGIVISHENVSLIGSGSDFVWDSGKFTSVYSKATPVNGTIIKEATAAPVITNITTPVDTDDLFTGNGVLVTAANAFISGLSVSNAAHSGIRVLADNQDLQNFTLVNSTINGSNSTGLAIGTINDGSLDSIFILDSDISGNRSTVSGGHGISITNRQSSAFAHGQIGNILIRNVTTNDNASAGVNITSNTGGIQNITLQDIATDNNSGNGVSITVTSAGQIGTIFLNNVTTTRSGSNGINLGASSSGILENMILQDVTIDRSTGSGISTNSTGNAFIGAITYSRVHISNSTDYGAYAHANSGSIGSFHVFDSVFEGNSNSGILARASSGQHLGSVIFENIESRSNSRGIHIQAAGGVIDSAIVNNAVLLNNVNQGIYIQLSGGGSNLNVTMNAIHAENNTRGLYANAGSNTNLTATLANSTFTNHSNSGLFLNSETTGIFDFSLGSGLLGPGNNRIFGNTGAGDVMLDLNGGVLSAQGNWWGQSPGPLPGQIIAENAADCPASCGTADTSGALDSDPAI